MKAQELRIHNWIKIISLTDGTEVETECELFHLQEMDKSVKYKYEPIPITEEWLLEFGFKLEIKQGNQKEFRVYSLNDFTYNTCHGWWWMQTGLLLDPTYVHQLQNLYFALTGEELTLNN